MLFGVPELVPAFRRLTGHTGEVRILRARIYGCKRATPRVHRSNTMRKIKAAWVAELCRMMDRAVQPANFGRELSGSSDSLPRYSTSLIAIRDPSVVATSGKTLPTIAGSPQWAYVRAQGYPCME
jgi:hypothetical protein